MSELADKIIDLLLSMRKATDTSRGTFGQKESLLFLLRTTPQPPRELMDRLNVKKSNLTPLAKKCLNAGWITKTPCADDRRALTYSLTDKGRAYIDGILAEIEKKFSTVLTGDSQTTTAVANLETAIELLSYL